jgi:hypothetical protein
MKKYVFLTLLLVLSSSAFAEQYASKAEVLRWKFPEANFQLVQDPSDHSEYPKMVLVKWVDSSAQPSEAEIATYTEEYLASQDYWVKRFDARQFFVDIKTNFSPTTLVGFRAEIAVLLKFADTKDFAGMKTYLNELVSNGIINQAKWTAVNSILKLQGIDLLEW